MRGWQREQLVFGVGAFAKPGVSFEQEYLKTPAADASRLRQFHARPGRVGRAPARGLVADADAHAAAVGRRAVRGGPRRVRPDCAVAIARIRAAACCFSMPLPSTRASSSACAGCPSRTSDAAEAGRPPRARAAAAADAPRVAVRSRRDRPGAARAALAPDADVRVVVGLLSLTRAVAEIDRLPDQARTPGVSPRATTRSPQIVNPHANPESVARRIRGDQLADDRSQRHGLPADRAREGGARAPGRDPRDQGRRRCGCWRSCAACSGCRSTR